MDTQKLSRREKRRPVSNCLKCVHVAFDEQWGEYICAALKRTIHDPERDTGCKDYKKA